MSAAKKLLAVAVGASALSFGVATEARADAYAFASNALTNFEVLVNSGAVTINNGGRNTINTALYSGFAPSSNADPVLIPNASNAAQATAGPGPFPAEDTFTQALLTNLGTRADSATSVGNPFVANGGTVSPAGGTGVASVDNVAEGHAANGPDGASDGRNTATARITFSAAGGTTLQFSFSDAIKLAASTVNANESAIATLANTFTLQDAAGNIVFSFTPNGTGSGLLDPFNVNGSLASDSGSPAATITNSGAFLSFVSPVLATGVYTLSLRSSATENVFSATAVPEPATLALLGVGLAGLGLVRRRKA